MSNGIHDERDEILDDEDIDDEEDVYEEVDDFSREDEDIPSDV